MTEGKWVLYAANVPRSHWARHGEHMNVWYHTGTKCYQATFGDTPDNIAGYYSAVGLSQFRGLISPMQWKVVYHEA